MGFELFFLACGAFIVSGALFTVSWLLARLSCGPGWRDRRVIVGIVNFFACLVIVSGLYVAVMLFSFSGFLRGLGAR